MKRLVLVLFLFIASVTGACCSVKPDLIQPADAGVAVEKEEAVVLKVSLTDQTPRKVASIVFDQPIDTASADAFESAMQALPPDTDLVLLVLDSPGGILKEARRMARMIEDSPRPVLCVADGMVASGAYYIFQSCTVRLMTVRSNLLIHEAYNDITADVAGARKELAALDSMNVAMSWQNCHRLSISPEACVAKYKGVDWWVSAGEAVEVGAVDALVPTSHDALMSLANLPQP